MWAFESYDSVSLLDGVFIAGRLIELGVVDHVSINQNLIQLGSGNNHWLLFSIESEKHILFLQSRYDNDQHNLLASKIEEYLKRNSSRLTRSDDEHSNQVWELIQHINE
jgi:hypothetical protein